MKDSILPNILEVAENHHLICNPKTINKKEVQYKCPFCQADANRDKFYLSLNEDKNVFKCWFCGERGGVLKFVSLLEGKTEKELINDLRKGSHYKKHPAEQLSRSQLEAIGYSKINWIKNRENDVTLYKAFREKVWKDWTALVKEKKRFCYQLLFVGLVSGDLKGSMEKVKKIEKELDEEFLQDLLNQLFKEDKMIKETFRLEKRACDLVGRVHPYETIDWTNNENEQGEDFMLNVCTFVGRLANDMELRFTSNGKAVGQFSLALTRALPDQNGERQADFIQCVVWGKAAENMSNTLLKGDTIGFQARVQTRSYENKQGQKVYVTEFIVEGFPQFLKVKNWENGQSNSIQENSKKRSNKKQGQGQGYQNQFNQDPFYANGQVNVSDDDLPF